MKNVIELVLDCGSYNRIVKTDNHRTPMPFFHSIKHKGLWFTKAYSQGPYTESALMGLTFGKDTLNDNGYFDSMFTWEGSIYEVFKRNGYDVFVTYSYSVMPPEIKTECFYSDAMNRGKPYFSRFVRSKLDYYYDLHKEDRINDIDYAIISGFLGTFFRIMLSYCTTQTLANDRTKYTAYEQRMQGELERIFLWRCQVEKEYDFFKHDKKNYVRNLMKNYKKHFLTTQCDLFSSKFASEIEDNRKWIKNQKRFWLRLYGYKMFYYLRSVEKLKSNKIYRKLLIFGNKQNRQKAKEFYLRYLKACFFYRRGKMIDNSLEQLLPCARNDIDSFMSWIEERNSKNPFYAYIHVDDYHGETTFCSYDSADRSVVEKEFDLAKQFLDKIVPCNSADVVKDLSLFYLDGCIKYLFERLSNTNLLKDTVVVITADHGCSNAGGQFRYTNTNNFYDEQYHIPLYVYDGLNTGVVNTYVNSKDIPMSLFSICGITNIPASYTGISAYSGKKRRYTNVEYMGSGIPDLQRRSVLFNFRDDNVSYTFAVKLEESLTNAQLLEYYDLHADPEELNNIAMFKKTYVTDLVKPFISRIEELKKNYFDYVKERKDFMVKENEHE